MGDAVNLASRVETATKRYRVTIMITGATHEALVVGFVARSLEELDVRCGT